MSYYSLAERYQKAVDELFAKVRNTQKEAIIRAGEMVAETAESGKKIYLSGICHSIENDLLYRGGGPLFYNHLPNLPDGDGTEGSAARRAIEQGIINPGELIFVSSVSGRTKSVVELAYEAQNAGIHVIAFTSMEYANAVEPVHSSGKKLYEIAELTLDNCAPAAEAMLEVEGIEARFAAASGIASDYIMWNLTSVAVEKMLADGYTPGILKSANFPGGTDYNNNVIQPHYDKYGW